MNFLYNFLVFITVILLRFIALYNHKINLFVTGRKETFIKLSNFTKEDKVIWFHVASLGEFEQARPIIENIKKEYRKYKILITFFSPSGYEIRKNYNLADTVCYLPLDSKSNAKKFIEKVNPIISVFVKYEFWPNFLKELKRKEITTILVSGILRKNQIFFMPFGGFMREALKAFHHFFVQDQHSKELLNRINFKNITVSGDTRFDCVIKILQENDALSFAEEFKNNQYTIVAGSTWKEDEDLLVNYINHQSLEDEKFIIAPHNINKKTIQKLKKAIHKKTVLFSEKEGKNLSEYQVLIVDVIGFLTKIYAFAEVVYVGGGLKTGLHNILEPAVFGIPIVIGNKFDKFKEAVDLTYLKGCFSIKNQQELSTIFQMLKANKEERTKIGAINKKYVENNIGATKLIMNYLKTKIK